MGGMREVTVAVDQAMAMAIDEAVSDDGYMSEGEVLREALDLWLENGSEKDGYVARLRRRPLTPRPRSTSRT